jgi:hypothetical protein
MIILIFPESPRMGAFFLGPEIIQGVLSELTLKVTLLSPPLGLREEEGRAEREESP